MDYALEMELYFELRGTPESSRESYRRRVRSFLGFLKQQGKCAETIETADIQQYVLHLKRERKLSAGTINTHISSVRFFCTQVLGKEWDRKRIPRVKHQRAMLVIPSRQEVLSLFSATENLKHRSLLSLMYGSGLRVSEVVSLRIGDICSQTMRVRVENAKHGTHRYTILSLSTLQLLRQYFRAYLPSKGYALQGWLFPAANPEAHINVKTVKNTMIKLRNRLGLDNRISAHTLRHCFATHALEDGVDPVLIQQLLGHRNLSTTSIYLHLTAKSLMGVKSPLDNLR